MISLRVSKEDALIAFSRVPHPRFQDAIGKYWHVDDDGVHVHSQSVCWLFCWAKSDTFHEESAKKARDAFNQLLTVSFEDFDHAVDLKTAQKYRYDEDRARVDAEIDRLLAQSDVPVTPRPYVPPTPVGPLVPNPEVSDIYAFIRSRGYRFPDWLVTDYLLSLATKPLVLLCGISGTGKTKLSQLVAEFVAPQTVQSVVDTPELELGDTEFVLTLTSKALNHISFAIPARVAPLLPWPEKGTGYDIDVVLDGQTVNAHMNNMGYDAQGEAVGLNVMFRKDFRGWLTDEAVQAGDRLRVAVAPGEPPTLNARLVRATRTLTQTSGAHIAFISVRPDWTDNRSLLGYLNPLTGQYSSTELLRLLLQARENPDEPHFAILDEMNLAKVEYYFSDFLSAMESGTEMVLHDSTGEVTVELDGTQVTVPRRLQIPRNVFFTGTVNVDETTYMFSPKVLDRANVIEFHDVDLRSYAAGAAAGGDGDFRLPDGADLAALLKHPGGAYEWAQPSDFAGLSASAKVRLLAIHDRLTRHNLHFGYRVANEVARFMNLVDTHVGPEVEAEALDMQLLQKVLPKLAGNAARLEQPLLELYADIAQADYPAAPGAACDLPRTAAKIGRMLEALRAVGFASFVE
jgi:energy-coupling factor transporter ATP-binding protein EcfA2